MWTPECLGGSLHPPFLSLTLSGASGCASGSTYALRACLVCPPPSLMCQSSNQRRLHSSAHPFFQTLAERGELILISCSLAPVSHIKVLSSPLFALHVCILLLRKYKTSQKFKSLNFCGCFCLFLFYFFSLYLNIKFFLHYYKKKTPNPKTNNNNKPQAFNFLISSL